MNKDKMLYYRFRTFRWLYQTFMKLNNRYSPDKKLLDKHYWRLYGSLKAFYMRYYKMLKYLFRIEGRKILIPKQIFEEAQKDGKINDGHIWISFIEYLNVIEFEEDRYLKTKMVKYVVEKFRSFVKPAYNNVAFPDIEKFFLDYTPIIEELEKQELHLADNKPIYNHKDINISENSYKILIDFFRSQKNLKNVWLHGSRAYGTNTYASDLDLFVDCPKEDFSAFCEGFNKLPIPYILDCKNLHNEKSLYWIKSMQQLGTKKIYCAEDFEQLS